MERCILERLGLVILGYLAELSNKRPKGLGEPDKRVDVNQFCRLSGSWIASRPDGTGTGGGPGSMSERQSTGATPMLRCPILVLAEDFGLL